MADSSPHPHFLPPTGRSTIEWPTLALAVVVYGVWCAAVLLYRWAGPLLGLPMLVLATCWFMSLQHELIHGQPFRSARLNRLLGILPLGAWFPFELYRSTHLAHHRDELLTQPGIDPESNYLSQEAYDVLPRWLQSVWIAQRTVLGRLTLGPALVIGATALEGVRGLRRGDLSLARVWLPHLALLAIVLAALDRWAGIGPLTYALGVGYPALAMAMLRSFYEHRPAADPACRVVVNEAGWFWRVLYLNNNYHAVHHERPSLPWYRLRRAYLADRSGILQRNGGFLISGYLPLLRRHALRAVDSPVHPSCS